MFGLPLPPWLNPTLIGGLLLVVAAFGGGMWLQHRLDAAPLAQAQRATAEVQSRYDGYKQGVATKAAQADAKALQQKQTDDANANAIQAKLAKSQKDADAKSKQLKAILDRAAPQDIRGLGPSALAYYNGLRAQSEAGHTANPGSP